MTRELRNALEQFKRCAGEAPSGAYDQAKHLNEVIGAACDNLIRDIRALGLRADTCDLIYAVEVAIYDYVKRSNPDNPLFPTAEGFGEAMTGPARERVMDQTARNVAFFKLHELGGDQSLGNTVIFGPSGLGMSGLANAVVEQQVEAGAKVYVLDKGPSNTWAPSTPPAHK